MASQRPQQTASKRRKITNSEEMQDALVEDYFRYDDLAQMEAEAIRHNVTGVKNDNIYYEEHEELELQEELGLERHGNDENNDSMTTREGRFKIYSDEDTDTFITEQRNVNTKLKTKSDIRIVKDFFATLNEFRDPADIPPKELDSLLARLYLGARKKDCAEYEPSSLQSINNSLDRYFKDNKLPFR